MKQSLSGILIAFMMLISFSFKSPPSDSNSNEPYVPPSTLASEQVAALFNQQMYGTISFNYSNQSNTTINIAAGTVVSGNLTGNSNVVFNFTGPVVFTGSVNYANNTNCYFNFNNNASFSGNGGFTVTAPSAGFYAKDFAVSSAHFLDLSTVKIKYSGTNATKLLYRTHLSNITYGGSACYQLLYGREDGSCTYNVCDSIEIGNLTASTTPEDKIVTGSIFTKVYFHNWTINCAQICCKGDYGTIDMTAANGLVDQFFKNGGWGYGVRVISASSLSGEPGGSMRVTNGYKVNGMKYGFAYVGIDPSILSQGLTGASIEVDHNAIVNSTSDPNSGPWTTGIYVTTSLVAGFPVNIHDNYGAGCPYYTLESPNGIYNSTGKPITATNNRVYTSASAAGVDPATGKPTSSSAAILVPPAVGPQFGSTPIPPIPPVNQPPVANAGPAQTVTGSTAILTGTGTDPDGSIATYTWSQVGTSPSKANLASSSTPGTSVASALVAGVYTFSLIVTDDKGLASTPSQTTVTVTAPPVQKFLTAAQTITASKQVQLIYSDGSIPPLLNSVRSCKVTPNGNYIIAVVTFANGTTTKYQ